MKTDYTLQSNYWRQSLTAKPLKELITLRHPALIMLLFWKKTTHQGVTWAVVVGMISSLGWILLSADTFTKVYGLPAEQALTPFGQPGIVTIPLGFLTLIVVSLMTQPKTTS